MNSISFSGLATGIDTTSLVETLVQAESIPIQRLRVKQANHDSMASRFGTIKGRLETLQEAMDAITDSSAPATVRSSGESMVRASALGDATPGAYSVEVSALASAERTHSDGFAGRDVAGYFADGSSIDITVGTDAAINVEVFAADTLDSIAQRINDSDARVSASLIFDGSDYRLQVSGEESGLENAITFAENGLSMGLTNPLNESVAAADAVFSIDGLAMTRSSNEISEAIPGVQLNLDSITNDPVTITVGSDSETLGEKMNAVVEAFNSVMNGINVESVFQGQARTGDSLSGDSTLRSLQRDLRSTLFSALPGFDTLSDVGLSTTQAGALEFDQAKFASELNSSEETLMQAFTGDGVTSGLFERLESVVDSYAESSDGLISMRIKNFESENRLIDDRIASMELRIDKYEENLLKKFASLETLVAGLNSQGEQMLAILGGL